ncbi:MAG: hypothetical protein HQL76_09295 [Magnetococcales bacterium]|nr:hypothetical protein [Magnetococcales bacterium]
MNIIELITLPWSQDPDADLLIRIRFQGRWLKHHSLTQARLREVLAIVDHFRSLFLHPLPAELEQTALISTGIELFDAWLAPSWPFLQTRIVPGEDLFLVVQSPLPEIILLPWELLRPPTHLPWIGNRGWSIRRKGGTPRTPHRFFHLHPPSPLKILATFPPHPPSAARHHRRIPPPLNQEMVELHWEPSGSFAGLLQEVHRLQPKGLILDGTTLVRANRGFFQFIDEGGNPDPRSGQEIATPELKESGIELLIILGQAPPGGPPPWSATALLADELANNGIPITMAWPDPSTCSSSRNVVPITEKAEMADVQGPPLMDNVLLSVFLKALAQGVPIDAALDRGRRESTPQQPPLRSPSVVIPLVFGALPALS